MKIEELDGWQKEILATEGDIVLRAGRQVGKSTIISIMAAEYAVANPKKSVMIISAVERQAFLLFTKVLMYLFDNHKVSIKAGKDRPTKSEIKLKNGTIIRCLPTGQDGLGIRGYTLDLLIADEAAFIGQDVYPAIIPALSTTGGRLILLSTPLGKQGFFWDCWNDTTGRFKKFHINAEDVAENRPEPMRTRMKQHQEEQKKTMTELQYQQEYLGEFVDDLRRLISDELIKRVCILRRHAFEQGYHYLGCDIARMGEDETTFEIIRKIGKNNFEQVENIVTTKTFLTQTTDKVIELDKSYKFRSIYIDSAGVGAGVFDILLREDQVKRKIVSIENASRPLNAPRSDEPLKGKRLLKEDLYMNFISMLEKGYLKLLDDDNLIESLRSIQYEYIIKEGQPTRLKIFGKYTHIAEGLIRASWCNQDKSLNIWVRWS